MYLQVEGIVYLEGNNEIGTIKIEDFQASGPVADVVDVGCFLLTANGINSVVE